MGVRIHGAAMTLWLIGCVEPRGEAPGVDAAAPADGSVRGEVAIADGVASAPDQAAPSAHDAAPAPIADAPTAPASDALPPPTADAAPAPIADAAPVSTPDAGTIWRPAPGTSWQWQLTGAIDTSVNVKMYDVDLFDVPDAVIAGLRAQGRIVICYFSAGSREDWRADAAMFPPATIGRPLDGWPGERWIDTRSEAVRAVMAARLDRAAARRCDGVEPDNVDGYTNNPGFPLDAASQLDFNRFLARQAHARGLSIGLKNDVDQVAELEPDFDWALNESCLQYDECDRLAPFIAAGKAVFHVEYGGEALAQTVCPRVRPLAFSTLIKKQNLDAWRVACP